MTEDSTTTETKEQTEIQRKYGLMRQESVADRKKKFGFKSDNDTSSGELFGMK